MIAEILEIEEILEGTNDINTLEDFNNFIKML